MKNKRDLENISEGSEKLPLPDRIVLELSAKCNLSCPICPRQYIKKTDGFMTKKLWEKLITEIADTNPDVIILPFWRGESLLHPHFTEMMNFALYKSLRIHISTNGQVLRKEDAEVLLRCEFVTFSIHTDLGYKNAKEFLFVRKGKSPIVQISFVQGEKTEELYNAVTKKADLEGFDTVRLYDEHTKGGVFGSSDHTIDLPRIFCPKLNDTLVVAYDGTVSRCNHIWKTEEGINMDDLSIKEVWSSDILGTIHCNYPDEQCEPCNQWTGHTCGESWKIIDGKAEHKKHGPCGDKA